MRQFDKLSIDVSSIPVSHDFHAISTVKLSKLRSRRLIALGKRALARKRKSRPAQTVLEICGLTIRRKLALKEPIKEESHEAVLGTNLVAIRFDRFCVHADSIRAKLALAVAIRYPICCWP
jgi:hypothetical protein